MSHLGRAAAAFGALALVVPGVAGAAAKKPKHDDGEDGLGAADDHAQEPQPQVR
jgi:hypothetical protein